MGNELGTDFISKYKSDDLFTVLALRKGLATKDFRKFSKGSLVCCQEGLRVFCLAIMSS